MEVTDDKGIRPDGEEVCGWRTPEERRLGIFVRCEGERRGSTDQTNVTTSFHDGKGGLCHRALWGDLIRVRYWLTTELMISPYQPQPWRPSEVRGEPDRNFLGALTLGSPMCSILRWDKRPPTSDETRSQSANGLAEHMTRSNFYPRGARDAIYREQSSPRCFWADSMSAGTRLVPGANTRWLHRPAISTGVDPAG